MKLYNKVYILTFLNQVIIYNENLLKLNISLYTISNINFFFIKNKIHIKNHIIKDVMSKEYTFVCFFYKFF